MAIQSSGYRFQDAEEDSPAQSDSDVMHSVEFYPSLDDYITVAIERGKKHNAYTSWAKIALQSFLIVNAIGLPVVLLIYGHPLLTIATLVLNIFLASFFLPKIVRFDYRRFFRSLYGEDFEDELIRVDLTHRGIVAHLRGDFGFYAWKNVTGIEDNGDAILIHFPTVSLPIRKSGFAYQEAQQLFLDYVRTRVKETRELKA